MRRLFALALAPLLVAGLPAGAQEPPPLEPAPGWGTAHIVLSGDHVGKQIRLSRNGRAILDRRFTTPPGPEDRAPVFISPLDSWTWLQVEIEGCAEPLNLRVALEPGKSTALVLDGCSARARLPE